MVIYGVMSQNSQIELKEFRKGSWLIEKDSNLLEVVSTVPQEQIWIKVGEMRPNWALPYISKETSRKYEGQEHNSLPLLTFMYGKDPIADFDISCMTRVGENLKMVLDKTDLALIPKGALIEGYSYPLYTELLTGEQYRGPIHGILAFYEGAPKEGILAVIGGYLRNDIGIGLADALDSDSMDDAHYRARRVHLLQQLQSPFSHYDEKPGDQEYVSLGIPSNGGSADDIAHFLHNLNEACDAERSQELIEPRFDPRKYKDIGLELIGLELLLGCPEWG